VAGDLRAALPPADRLLGPTNEHGGGARLLIKSPDRVASVGVLARLRVAWSADGHDVRVDVDPVDVG
jgi:hypothetical protein